MYILGYSYSNESGCFFTVEIIRACFEAGQSGIETVIYGQ